MMADTGYDAFISYSHKHDAMLGPALQANLERFAKPWYRMRALRIFRDTANLAANPALWQSIEDALRSSEWFLLLASADAAESEWVDREVQWWLTHRSPDRLLVVGSGSGLAWDKQKQDWTADAPVPPALSGAFTSEPLWVDLSDIQLDSRKPIIPADRVAAVAAPIRGVEKDRLVGEHLEHHRRAMHLAGGAVAVLAMLTALAITASFIAYGERNTAIQQRDQAIANQVAVEAGDLTTTDPSLAAQLDVLTNKIRPTPDSKTRLLNTTTIAAVQPVDRPHQQRQLGGVQPGRPDPRRRQRRRQGLAVEPQPPGRPRPARPAPHRPRGHRQLGGVQPGRRTLAAGSYDGKVWLWNLNDPARPCPARPAPDRPHG